MTEKAFLEYLASEEHVQSAKENAANLSHDQAVEDATDDVHIEQMNSARASILDSMKARAVALDRPGRKPHFLCLGPQFPPIIRKNTAPPAPPQPPWNLDDITIMAPMTATILQSGTNYIVVNIAISSLLEALLLFVLGLNGLKVFYTTGSLEGQTATITGASITFYLGGLQLTLNGPVGAPGDIISLVDQQILDSRMTDNPFLYAAAEPLETPASYQPARKFRSRWNSGMFLRYHTHLGTFPWLGRYDNHRTMFQDQSSHLDIRRDYVLERLETGES